MAAANDLTTLPARVLHSPGTADRWVHPQGLARGGKREMSGVLSVEYVLGLLALVALLAMLARVVRVPYPILFVLGGLALALIPHAPTVTIAPDVIFLIFLPPLLYFTSIFVSPRELRANLWPIALLAIGLVLVTMGVVALAAHALTGMPYAQAFALGAILGPTDATVAVAITERLPLPRDVLSILEGESLFNDATSLVLYQIAVLAIVSGHFSAVTAAPRFAVDALGGIVIGIVVGWVSAQIRNRVDESQIEITLALLTPFVAWIPAERLGVSAVLAVVAAGIYIGQERFSRIPVLTRLRGVAFWQVLIFLLEGLLFVLTGLQFRVVLVAANGASITALIGVGLVLAVIIVLVRALWIFCAGWLSFVLHIAPPSVTRGELLREMTVITWTGMRGADSLVPALAIPTLTAAGLAIGDRGGILLLTFVVILATMLGQGLTLPLLIRRLGVGPHASEQREVAAARVQITETALARLGDLARQVGAPEPSAEAVRAELEHHLRDLTGRTSPRHRRRDHAAHVLRQDVLSLERAEAIRLRDAGAISDEALHAIEHELDLEVLGLDAEDPDDFDRDEQTHEREEPAAI